MAGSLGAAQMSGPGPSKANGAAEALMADLMPDEEDLLYEVGLLCAPTGWGKRSHSGAGAGGAAAQPLQPEDVAPVPGRPQVGAAPQALPPL